MKLDIKPISQRDPEFGSKKLGFGNGNISNYGCLLVCHTMLLQYYGEKVTVDSLNELYKSKKVFDGNLINYWAAAKCFDDITAEDDIHNYYTEACDMDLVDKYLSERKPVILGIGASPVNPKKVDYDGMIDHFVLLTGKDENGEYIIIDPYFGEEYYFSAKYGKNIEEYIFGLRLYNGLVPEENGESTDALKAINKRLREQLAEEGQLITDLRGDVFKLQQAEAADQVELVELRERNRKLELDAGRLLKLEEAVLDLKLDKDALKLDLALLKKAKVEKWPTKQIVDLLIRRIFRR